MFNKFRRRMHEESMLMKVEFVTDNSRGKGRKANAMRKLLQTCGNIDDANLIFSCLRLVRCARHRHCHPRLLRDDTTRIDTQRCTRSPPR